MKPYNERLPLIDASIVNFNGEMPKFYNKLYVQHGEVIRYTGIKEPDFDFVCTHEEFEQRARELGYINGYKYGVEYETNGEKPDLPDDVLVEYKSKWVGWLRYDDGHDNVENWAWENSTAFKIYDERYKPQNASEIPESNNNLENVIMNNDWYEKGELPPVGSVVRHKESGKDVEVKCHLRTGQAIGERLCHPLIEIGFASDFEPLRTETDKLVEQMERSFENTVCISTNNHRAVAELLTGKGYRKVKLMSEDEFVDKVESIYGVRDLSVATLYRAGCRFLDQGE